MPKDWIQLFLTVSAVFTFNALVFILIYTKIDLASKDIALIMFGQAATTYTLVYSYHFNRQHRKTLQNHQKKLDDLQAHVDSLKKV